MKTNLLATLALAAASVPMMAQTVTSFPSLMPRSQATAATENGMMRAPLNPDINSGTKVFGATLIDYDSSFHFFDVWSEKTSQLNKHMSLCATDLGDNEEFSKMYMAWAGTWVRDKWMGVRIKYYTYGPTLIPDYWIGADEKTGNWDIISTYPYQLDNGRYYYQDWMPQTDFAWNPADDKLYAMEYSLEKNPYGAVTTRLCLYDETNGERIKVIKEMGEYYFCMAFNYDGDLYALRWEYNAKGETVGTVLDIFDPTDDFYLIESTPILVDGKQFKIDYQNALAFDYTTGDLWWGATDNNAQQDLVKINPDNYSTVRKGRIGFNECFIGMHVPYVTADSRTAPARVENMSFTVDTNGENKVTINWTNPSTCWNRTKLSNLAEVLVYRDSYSGTPIAKVPASGQVGKEMSYTDEGATKGVHTYYVVPCAKAGEKGIVNSIDAFVGHDVPGPVERVNALTLDGKTIDLSWRQPTVGANSGWFDKTTLEYHIVRLPDNKDCGTIKKTNFTDNDLAEAQLYSYIITPVNADGEGTPVTTEGVLAGSSVLVPFSTNFATKVEADRFTGIDSNGDGRRWEYDYNTNKTRETFKLSCTNYTNGAILVSPPLRVKKGTNYKVTYKTSIGGYGMSDRIYMLKYRFVGGTEATVEGLSDTFEQWEDHVVSGLYSQDDFVTYFTAPIDGDYYFGWENITDDEQEWWLYCEGFEITEAPATDLDAQALKSYKTLSNIGDNKFEVTVYNNGSTDITDYKVQIATLDEEGNPVVFAESKAAPAIKSHETTVVTLMGHPAETIAGEAKIIAIAVVEGDGYEGNNMTDPIDVMIDFSEPYTNTVNMGEENTTNTHLPFHHSNAAIASQTIYTPNMTGLPKDLEKPQVHRIAWEYSTEETIDGTRVQLFMQHTDITGYENGTISDWIAPTGTPLFDGEVQFAAGQHNQASMDFDEPFDLDPTRPFVLTVNKFEAAHSGFLVHFNCFDENWNLPLYHSLRCYGGNEMMDAKAPTGNWYREPQAPVLHLAISSEATGVEEIVITGNGTYFFNSTTGVLHANGADVRKVEVFDLAGRAISAVNPAKGQNEINLGLAKGIYVIRVTEANGTTASLKVNR